MSACWTTTPGRELLGSGSVDPLPATASTAHKSSTKCADTLSGLPISKVICSELDAARLARDIHGVAEEAVGGLFDAAIDTGRSDGAHQIGME